MIICKIIYVPAIAIISFFCMEELYTTVYIDHFFFICSSVHGHFVCLHILGIVNGAAVPAWVRVFFRLLDLSAYNFRGNCRIIG